MVLIEETREGECQVKVAESTTKRPQTFTLPLKNPTETEQNALSHVLEGLKKASSKHVMMRMEKSEGGILLPSGG